MPERNNKRQVAGISERELVTREPSGLKKLKSAAEAGKKGNYPLAIRILGELICETDAPPQAWLLLGRSFHALKDYSRALAAFNDYIRHKPGEGEGYLFAGRTYLTLGMPYKAVPLLRKAMENSPGDSRTKAILGTAYLKSKNSQAAVQMLEEAVQAAPGNKRIYRAYLNSLLVRGIRLCNIEEYELGLQMLRFVLLNGEDAGFVNNTFLRLELGRAARETGNLEEALEHFTQALSLSKDDSKDRGDRRIRWSRASILMALGRNTEARKDIEEIRLHDENVPELPWNSELADLFMIRSLLSDGEWRAAATSCRDWLRKREEQPMIRALYAEAMRNLRDFKAAHNHLKRALEKKPGELEFWYAQILVSWEGGDYKSLKKALKAAASMGGDPDIIERFTVLCQARTAKDAQGNITLLQNAIRSLGPDPELMNVLGEAYLKVGLLEEARSWFKKTILLKDSHETARLGEIAALEALIAEGAGAGSLKDMVRDLSSLYQAYLDRWPENVSLRRERAMFLVKTFEYAEAAAELEKLLVWEPSNPSLRRVLAYTYRKTGRYREAALFLKSLLKEKPRDIELLIEYTGCLERVGAVQYAVAVLEKARDLFKGCADISLVLGIFNFRQNDVKMAFHYLREAAAFNTRDPRPYEWMAVIARKNGYSMDGDHYAQEAEARKKRS
ncbi:MAG: tetratricopeptide repeat protein [Treponema sp.]|nr:tetratricopeptide repeat protein [Treponema sp.]